MRRLGYDECDSDALKVAGYAKERKMIMEPKRFNAQLFLRDGLKQVQEDIKHYKALVRSLQEQEVTIKALIGKRGVIDPDNSVVVRKRKEGKAPDELIGRIRTLLDSSGPLSTGALLANLSPAGVTKAMLERALRFALAEPSHGIVRIRRGVYRVVQQPLGTPHHFIKGLERAGGDNPAVRHITTHWIDTEV